MKHIVKGVAPAPELSFALQLGFLTLERGEQGSLRNPESVLAKSSWAPSDASTYPECLMGEGVSFSPSTGTRASRGTYGRLAAPT